MPSQVIRRFHYDPEAKRLVWDWKRQFGSQAFAGLEQLPYWFTQLERSAAGTPNGDFVEGVIRDLLARYGIQGLESLLASWRIARGGIPATRRELVEHLERIDPFVPAVDAGPWPGDLGELLDAKLIRRRYPGGLPAWGPIAVADDRLTLKTDPFGLPWRLEGGHVVTFSMRSVPSELRLF